MGYDRHDPLTSIAMIRSSKHQLSSLSSTSIGDLRSIRIVSVASALIFLGFFIASQAVHPQSYDPLWLRLAFAGGCLAVLAASYLKRQARPNLLPFLYGLMAFACLWSIWIAYRNDFAIDRLIAVVLLCLACGTSFLRTRPQVMFLITMGTAISIAGLASEQGQSQGLLILAHLFTFVIFVFFMAMYRDGHISRLERLSMVARRTHSAVMLLSEKGQPEWMNDGAETLLGGWAEALREKSTENLSPEEAERLRTFQGLLAQGAPFRQEVNLQGREGGSRWVDLDVSPISLASPGRRTRGYVVIGREITAQKAAEQELRRSEIRYRRLVENSPMPIIALRGVKIFYANRAAAWLLRVAAPSLLTGLRLPDYVVSEDRRSAETWLAEEGREEGGSREFAMNRLDGKGRIDVQVQAITVVFAGQEVLQLVLTDLTERKQVERAKDDFVSTVNHELRTPLTSLRGSLGLLDAGIFEQGGDRARMLVDLALRNTERLTILINDLLDMQKIEAGKADFHMEVIELSELVRSAIENNRLFADRFDISFRFSRTVPGAYVRADPNRIGQVLSNLLSNAAKFSPDGGVVDIFVDRMNEELRVTVVDRGPGVPESFEGELFDKFSRSEDSELRQVAGTGLGLAISRAIVVKHGGSIALDREYKEGAAFYFTLPELGSTASSRKGASTLSA